MARESNSSWLNCNHRNLSIHTERVLCEICLQTVMYRSKIGIVRSRMFGVRSTIFLFSRLVQDYGNRAAGVCLVIQAVGQAEHFLSM